METKEAIHKLEFMRNAYQHLIDENVDEGRFIGTDVTGTWKADTPLNEVYREHVEALDMAISAIKSRKKRNLLCILKTVSIMQLKTGSRSLHGNRL